MLIDAVFPTASEVVMVYGGAVAAGAFAGQSVTLFGHTFADGLPAYLAMALAGTIGYLIGAIAGWAIGDAAGGRTSSATAAGCISTRRSSTGPRPGSTAGATGPCSSAASRRSSARSSRSRPASSDCPLGRYVVLTLVGSALWCFAFAGAGWAAGASWESFHEAFRYADVAVAAVVVADRRAGWRGSCCADGASCTSA